jgi:hypothetical protein
MFIAIINFKMTIKTRELINVRENHRAIKNGQSRDTDAIGNIRHRTNTNNNKMKTTRTTKERSNTDTTMAVSLDCPFLIALWFSLTFINSRVLIVRCRIHVIACQVLFLFNINFVSVLHVNISDVRPSLLQRKI